MDEPFKEITEDQTSEILKIIKTDFPRGIHAFSFITTILKWKKEGVPSGIFTPGDYDCGAVFYYMLTGERRFDCSFYSWTKVGNEKLCQALNKTKIIKWKEDKILITCIPNDLLPILENISSLELKYSIDTVMWLPAEKAKNIELPKLPENTYLEKLKVEHAEIINSVWPHRNNESIELVKKAISLNFGIGLFSNDGILLSWACLWHYGGIGAVQTAEGHKRKGYATIIVKAICKEFGIQGLDVHLNVVAGNKVGYDFFTSLDIGFKFAFKGVWNISSNYYSNS